VEGAGALEWFADGGPEFEDTPLATGFVDIA